MLMYEKNIFEPYIQRYNGSTGRISYDFFTLFDLTKACIYC